MATEINVWANHQLSFSSAIEGVKAFELKVAKNISHWNFKVDDPLKITTNLSEVNYFTNSEILDHNFMRWNEIKIKTNFRYCSEIVILKNVVRIFPTQFRTRYSKWLELVSGQFTSTDENEIQKMMEWRKDWLKFRAYIHLLIRELGGHKIIYLNDHAYQDEEDLFYQGGTLDEVTELLRNSIEPCELELYEMFPNERRAKYTWHFDDLST